LIAYFIGNVSAKKISKSVDMCQSYSKSKVGSFLRHGVGDGGYVNFKLGENYHQGKTHKSSAAAEMGTWPQ